MESRSGVSDSVDDQLVIVLHIEEGISLNSTDAILIQATLSGNKLDSEPVKPGHTTLFDCDLIWETDKKSIKRMKTENLPVKLECFSLRNYKGNLNESIKEQIGYILVPVRNIPVLPLAKALQAKPRWQKLIGLPKDWRQHKPELLLNVMITDKEFLTCDKTGILESHGSDSIVIEENPVPCMLTSQKGIFVRLLQQEGLLQVGNIDTNCDVFLVKILLKNLRYLENMIANESDKSNQELYINYILLGNQHTRILDKKFNRTHHIQEKVSINFRSSLKTLREYFEKIFFIPIEIMSGKQLLGSANIKLSEFIKCIELKDFLGKFHTGLFEVDGISNIKSAQQIDPNQNHPILEYRFSIQYIATKKLHQTELLETYKKCQEIDLKAGGDHAQEQSIVLPTIKMPIGEECPKIFDIPDNRSEAVLSLKTKKADVEKPSLDCKKLSYAKSDSNMKLGASFTQPEKTDIDSILKTQDNGQISEIPRLFSYNLQITSIKFDHKPEKGIWQMSFFHDKADTSRTFLNKEIRDADLTQNTLDFDDLELKLYFTSHAGNIMDLIKSSDMCTICVKGPHRIHAKAQLDCHNLLIGNKEKACGTILLKNPNQDVVAMAEIFVYLDDLGINFNQLTSTETQNIEDFENKDINATRTLNEHRQMLLDESLAYKMIEELEEWKSAQQESFIADLKQNEIRYLERLKNDWNEKCEQYERDLVLKSDKLSHITQSLEHAKEEFKNSDGQKNKDQRELQLIKRNLEQSFCNQLLSIRERARRLEDDLRHEMKIKDIKHDDLERCKQHLEQENCELKNTIECLRVELCELKSNLIPKSEVEHLLKNMRLLNEKLETMECENLFYKDQWTKSFRECYDTKREKIWKAREEIADVKYDRVCEILDQEQCQLDFDKDELDEIKKFLYMSD